jgi:N-formylglutamate amidohydrolase
MIHSAAAGAERPATDMAYPTGREAAEAGNGAPSRATLLDEPFVVHEPGERRLPFVFASPHSGRLYPESFLRRSRLSALNLRRSEDAYVDELFASAVDIGAPLIAARFPRAFLDVNRSAAEIDTAMFDGPLRLAVDSVSPRVSAGLGVIPRIVRDGAEIYRDKLSANEAESRLALFYQPYHAALDNLIAETQRRFGTALLLDCHSMPSAAAVPDIILGDRYGLSAAPAVTRAVERAFEAQGFKVSRNVPYSGGFTTQRHGRPAVGIHALQIEINRALYLNEEAIEQSGAFREVEAHIAAALRSLAMIDELPGRMSDLRHAAE